MNKLQKEIKGAYDKYVAENGEEPKFTDVAIRFRNEDSAMDVVIKLEDSTEEEQMGGGDDNEIFYYCDGIDDLIELCREDNGEDFEVVDFFGYFYNEL